jgi:NAD(P)-dependent dehydrogenase (short-subunit alcohol dehydrogenase family)
MEGKVAIVTGGGQGLGEAAVRAFVAKGVSVCIADVKPDRGEALAAELNDQGAKTIFVRADISSPGDVAALVDTAVSTFGGLDFAFNNAGVLEDRALTADIPLAQWQRVIGVNLTGTWLCIAAEVPAMIERGGGVIVNTASMAGLYGGASWHMAAYGASKAAVISLTRVAARDYADQGIRVVAICPGPIDTEMMRGTASANADWATAVSATRPMGRMGRPEEIGNTVVWICSDEASYISGHNFAVDGAAYC